MDGSRRRLLRLSGGMGLLGLAGGVAGCGFRPVYGTGGADGGADAAEDLAATQVGIIADREGQILHNLLLDRFNPRGRPTEPRHSLSTAVSIAISELGTQIDETTTRSQVTVSATSTLNAFGEAHSFRSRIVATFSTTESEYASSVAEQDAIKRAMVVIADDIRLQVATFFERQRLLQS